MSTELSSAFFIIDGPKLCAQAHFLVLSILANMRGKAHFIAYVREGQISAIPEALRRLLDLAEIDLRAIPNTASGEPAPWTSDYPIGNKLLAAAQPRKQPTAVFLDTDVVFCQPVDFAAELADAPVGAVLSDYRTTFSFTPDWQPVYDFYQLPLPDERPGTLSRPNIDYPPYFNAGVVIFREQVAGHQHRTGEEWLQMSLDLDHHFDIGAARVNMDQISLSALGARLGGKTAMLPPRLNFNIMRNPVTDDTSLQIAHYHKMGRLWKNPAVGAPLLQWMQTYMQPDDIAWFTNEYAEHLRWGLARKLMARQTPLH